MQEFIVCVAQQQVSSNIAKQQHLLATTFYCH